MDRMVGSQKSTPTKNASRAKRQLRDLSRWLLSTPSSPTTRAQRSERRTESKRQHNCSWNCGVEGPASDPAIEKLRNRQVKNFLTTTLMSLGMPMITMGDEVRRTQRGNNNAYCQDNEISWFDWALVNKHADIHRFVTLLNAYRGQRRTEHEGQRVSLSALLRGATKGWHGVKLNQPDWGDNSRSLALSGEIRQEGIAFHLMLNAFWEPLEFELPPLAKGKWRRWTTALVAPGDIVSWEKLQT